MSDTIKLILGIVIISAICLICTFFCILGYIKQELKRNDRKN